MSRRKSNQNFEKFHQVEVFDIAEEGKGVSRIDDCVVFIESSVPGDIAEIEIYRKKKNFAEAKISSLIQPSKDRVEPFCSHFGVCGGCKWQHLNYDAQLHFKEKSVQNALERIGKVDAAHIEKILPSENTLYYRNKLEYTFSNKKWLTLDEMGLGEQDMDALGFHVPGRFDKILEINHCYLQADPSNSIRLSLAKFSKENDISFYDLRAHEGSLRNLIIRTSSTGETMVIVVFAYADDEVIEKVMGFLHAEYPDLASLLYVVNHKKNDTIFDQDIHVYSGQDFIMEEMEGLKFKVGPKSFYQTNSHQAYNLYKLTREFAGLSGNELVYDLYTGAGTIANFVAKSAKKVVGVEYVPTAIEDAKINSQINNIHNTVFYAGDMKDVLTADFVRENGKPDVIITDPPRAGMHTDVVNRILEIEAPKVVYVSCNAATQARDLQLLSQKYEVTRIKPVDMFPHTQHVENVVLLTLKTSF